MLTRRALIESTLKASAGVALTPAMRCLAATGPSIALRPSQAAPSLLPPDFIGLGYEMSSVAPIGLLSEKNDRYVQLIKQLGRQGVLRVGGIVADYTRYEPAGSVTADPHNTVITRADLDQFAAFLKKTGWTTIWSLNFAQGTLEDAVVEAKAVASVLDSSLQAFELGNEVENYDRGSKPFRKSPYTYETYRAEYDQWRAAILKAVPNARFAAPDTAGNVQWVERMAKDAHGTVQLLTTHYYRNNQKQGSAEQLLQQDPKLLDTLTRLRTSAQQSGIPWRMCETNSFSGGGRPGVSDTFLGTLWTLDFLALLAQYGCSGVNIETGVNQLGFISSYSPIQDDGEGVNSAGAPYYGMLAFAVARAGCTHSIALDLPLGATGLTAYAFGSGRQVQSAVLINRSDEDRSLTLEELGMRDCSTMLLSAPAIDSKNEINFAAAAVASNGTWKPAAAKQIRGSQLRLARMSAVVALRKGFAGAVE